MVLRTWKANDKKILKNFYSMENLKVNCSKTWNKDTLSWNKDTLSRRSETDLGF